VVPADDPELRAGTSAHYEDAAYYTKTYASRRQDVLFYVDRAERSGGSVLEYGCGNGRILIPTARAGIEIVGVDLSDTMLADLAERLAAEPAEVRARALVKKGDMRAVALRRRFALVTCPFNAFLHLYERVDIERFLARVKAHLAPKGRFVLDVSVPDAEELARKPERAYRTRPFVYPGVGRVRYAERFDYDPIRQILFVSMEFEPMDGSEPFMTPLAHRQIYPRELEAMLHYAGFAIEERIGDFDGPVEPETRTLVLVARARS